MTSLVTVMHGDAPHMNVPTVIFMIILTMVAAVVVTMIILIKIL